jgi:hypothetical protein
LNIVNNDNKQQPIIWHYLWQWLEDWMKVTHSTFPNYNECNGYSILPFVKHHHYVYKVLQNLWCKVNRLNVGEYKSMQLHKMKNNAIPCIDWCQMLCQTPLPIFRHHFTLPRSLDSRGERGVMLGWYIQI